jgi:protein-S-isoprenylcysteine O-methyltransferase Ste14
VWVLSVSFGDSISLVNGIPWVHRTNDFGAILIAAIVLLFVSSVVSNIARTNLVFGVILTITQVLFSILLVILFYLIAACLGDRKRPD